MTKTSRCRQPVFYISENGQSFNVVLIGRCRSKFHNWIGDIFWNNEYNQMLLKSHSQKRSLFGHRGWRTSKVNLWQWFSNLAHTQKNPTIQKFLFLKLFPNDRKYVCLFFFWNPCTNVYNNFFNSFTFLFCNDKAWQSFY